MKVKPRPMQEVLSSTLQTRLSMIEGEADGIIREYPDSAAVARLAYLVGYLTKIVKTHLRSGER